MSKRFVLFLLVFVSSAAQLWAAASLMLYPVRVDLTGARTDSVIRITNNAAEPVTLQARVYRWGFDERGDILTYCAVAEWLETHIPDAEVWYGGDSSSVLAAPFGETERRAHAGEIRG